jgi:hypothetical protein
MSEVECRHERDHGLESEWDEDRQATLHRCTGCDEVVYIESVAMQEVGDRDE